MKLNPNQKEAVQHKSGPLLIVAGAGTGKTTVITERIRYLIKDKKVDPQQIFTTTFTQKTSQELLGRLDAVMPMGYREPWIGTFHSLCDRILRMESLEIGLDPGFRIMTQTDQWMFLREHLFNFDLHYYRPLGNPAKFISALIRVFSRIQDETISAAEFDSYAKKVKSSATTDEEEIEADRLLEVSGAYQTYKQLKTENSLIDFGDLIGQTIKLFSIRPNILKKYQQQFQHILIDEFQDTNLAQYQLVKLLAPKKNYPNLIVVGDDDQAIYKFRGASVANILQFKSDYPKAFEIILVKNYRSNQAILDHAYQTIIHNNPDRLETKLKLDKKLISQNNLNSSPETIQFDNYDQEIDWTIEQILKLISSGNIKYQDIAILTRSNSQLEPYVVACKRNGIPYQLVGNRGLFDQPEIQNLIYFLQVLADPKDDQNLFQLSNMDIFDISQVKLLENMKLANLKSSSLWEQLQTSEDKNTKKFIQLLKEYQILLKDKSVSQILYQFINQENYLKPYIEKESIQNQLKIKNLNLFFEKIKQYEAVSNNTHVTNFLKTLELWLEAGENPGQAQIEDIDTVSLMTVHAAKGLEFQTVFIGSLVAGRFPGINRKDPITIPDALIKETLPTGDIHIQEERRLFYVGMTRAKQHLYLTCAIDYGGKKEWKPSGFIQETGIKIQKSEHQNQPNLTSTTADPTLTYLKAGKYQIDKLSYSKIDTFKLCPLKYKYRYLLQIPARPHHSLSFGRSIHNTLQQFHELQLHGDELTQKKLIDLFDQNFIDEGYDSPEHKKARYGSGVSALKDYYHNFQKLLGTPEMLEQKFNLKIDDVIFTGSIDRIDIDKVGEYQIIDYKTGSHKDQKQVDKDDQLTLYALAAQEALNLDISGMGLYFLEDKGEFITTTRTGKQLKQARNKLSKDIETIKTSKFPATPNSFKCGFCEYRQLCPYAILKK